MAKTHYKQVIADFAVIYCRVSSENQARYGSSIESQKASCLSKAKELNVEVENIFVDNAISGSQGKRLGWDSLVAHILSNPTKNYYIISEDITRIARGEAFREMVAPILHTQRFAIKTIKQEFNNTPESNFMLNIMLAVGGFERENNQRRVIDKQSARIISGYWPFPAPLGYIQPSKLGIKDKIIRKDEPFDKIIKEAFEGYSYGKFDTLADVTRFMSNQPAIQAKYKSGKIHKDAVGKIFRNILYTGHIALPEWEIPVTKAKHEPIIPIDLFYKVQEKLLGNVLPPYNGTKLRVRV